MNMTELYIRLKSRYDSTTRFLSKYLYSAEYAKQRLILHLVFIVAAVLSAAVYGYLTGVYHFFKIGLLLGFLDMCSIIFKLSKLRNI